MSNANTSYDIQYREDSALRFKHAAEDKLTPTGRLKKRADPVVFRGLADRAIDAIKGLIDINPGNPNYRRWLAETEEIILNTR